MTPRQWAWATFKTAILAAAAVWVTLTFVIMADSFTHPPEAIVDWREPGPWVDWRTYSFAVDRLLSGRGIYAPEQLAGPYQLTQMVFVGYAYPPPSVVLFLPFASYPLGLAAFITLNLGLFLTAVWAIVTRAWPRFRVPIFALLLFLLSYDGAFMGGVITGSVNLGIAGLIGWTALGGVGRFSGLIGGLGAIVKVLPGVLALTGPNKLRSILVATGVVAVVSLVTLPLVGVQSWIDFAKALAGAVPDCTPDNRSIACTFGPLLGTSNAVLLGLGIGSLCAFAMLFVRDTLALAILATVAIMALASNLHPHFWLMAEIVGIALVARLSDEVGSRVARRSARPAAAPVPEVS